MAQGLNSASQGRPLYTADERRRRDSTIWTLVQGVLAPLQFVVFLISLVLVIRFLWTGQGAEAAIASVVIKTLVLYAIMIKAFFWEDVVSMLVLALHTAYLAAWILNWGDTRFQMLIALAAYASYVINAGQFLAKLRMARLSAPPASPGEFDTAEPAQ